MPSILDDLSAALQGAVDWTFSDAILLAEGVKTANTSGHVTATSVEHGCRAKVDKKDTRASDGELKRITRVLILVGSLSVEPQRGNKLTGLDRPYKLGKCDRDGLGSHWVCEVENG